ncbi:sensor histidine kinase [Vallitalea guaymasensis]|uniref:Histidine kinase n=1 Tax=Vallitalea guaymasensis TaxID=1185412 RepID=A0A8J8MEZ0_9FIRM|nr:histidine kinase [Vallitalea guaymasensis]QUH31385.1 histidine kinase [Vallitalea guaymasensis]
MFRVKRFSTKLLISYLVIICLFIIVSAAFIYDQFYKTLDQQTANFVFEILDSESTSLNETTAHMESIILGISVNSTLNEFIRSASTYSDKEYTDNYSNTVEPLLDWIVKSNNEISRINMFTTNTHIHDVGYFFNYNQYMKEGWFPEEVQEQQLYQTYWDKMHRHRDYLKVNSSDGYVYSLFYWYEIGDNKALIEFEISTNILFSSLKDYSISKSGYITIYDFPLNRFLKDDPILNYLRTNQEFILALQENEKGIYHFNYEDIDYEAFFNQANITGSYLITIIPEKEIKNLIPVNKNIVYFLSGFVIIIIGLAIIFQRSFASRIVSVQKAIKQVEKGDFSIHIPVKGKDEIDMLANDFNIMATKIEDLINKVYVSEIERKQAELFALQSQIRPHFIYNTLESIRMLAEINDEEEISSGLMALGQLIRSKNHSSEDLITIKDEIKTVENYITVENITHNNRIHFQVDVDENIESLKIINMILQPILENSIIHGFNSGYDLNITMGIKTDGKMLQITVDDDGLGVDNDRLIELKNSLLEMKYNKNISIGLINVQKRIKLYFGEAYGIEVIQLEKGLRVVIKLPVIS